MTFSRQPFTETVDTAFFFPGGARKDIVNEIRLCLAQGIPLITLTGPEGTGKTMISKVVSNNLPAEIMPLMFDDGVESFDDMVRVIADQVLTDKDTPQEPRDSSALFILADHDDHSDKQDTKALLDEIVRNVRGRSQRLLIILDKAENIYLAPLERIRRMLDRVNEGAVAIQLMLVGRPALSESFDQLSIVKFQDIDERHFVLELIDSETSRLYLNHCIMVGTGEGQSEFFTRETVAKIFSVAKGNFRKINALAREYLKANELDDSFLSLIEIEEAAEIPIIEEEERPIRSRVRAGMPNVDLDFLKLPSFKPEWLFYGGGVCAVILMLILLMGGSEDEPEPQPGAGDVPVLELTEVEPLETEVTQPVDPPVVEPVTTVEPPVLPDQPEVPTGPALAEEVVQEPPTEVVQEQPTEEVEETPAEPPVAVAMVQADPEPIEEPVEEQLPVELPTQVQAEEEQVAADEIPEQVPPEPPAEETVAEPDTPEPVEQEAKIVVTPLKEKREPPATQSIEILESVGKKQPAPGEAAAAPATPVDVETLYRQRLAAGARWLVESDEETFTVQLMVLTSMQAEDNLKEMLQTQNYRSIADDLFILRKLGDVPTVKLFYGEFDSLAEARQTRNNLPLFLRIHRPFTVTITDAVANTRSIQ